jgi:uncharacterized protein YjbI with pentapeptide repeats
LYGSPKGRNLDESDRTDADLRGADLREASLAGADLTNADLRDLHWEHIVNLRNANIFGVMNAPPGSVEWAIKHGAQRQDTETREPG